MRVPSEIHLDRTSQQGILTSILFEPRSKALNQYLPHHLVNAESTFAIRSDSRLNGTRLELRLPNLGRGCLTPHFSKEITNILVFHQHLFCIRFNLRDCASDLCQKHCGGLDAICAGGNLSNTQHGQRWIHAFAIAVPSTAGSHLLSQVN